MTMFFFFDCLDVSAKKICIKHITGNVHITKACDVLQT